MERTAPSLTGRGFARPRNLSPRSSEALVRRPAAERDGLPLLIEAQAPGLSLADWIREQGQSLHDDLNLAGGLLLRGLRGRLGGALPRSRRCLRPATARLQGAFLAA